MVNGLEEEDDPALHKVMVVSDNTKHLAVADTRKLGIEVIKAGAFVDSLFDAAPARVSQAIAKSLSDLTKPPYTAAAPRESNRESGSEQHLRPTTAMK